MKYTEQQIITAMKGTGGIVSQILANLKKFTKVDESYTRQALHKRIGESDILKEAYANEQEHIGDIVETGFYRALQDEKEWAMKEWFKYKGYTRGYVQNKIIENKGDNTVAEILKAAGLTGGQDGTDNDGTTKGSSKNKT